MITRCLRCGNCGTRRETHSSKVTRLLSGKAGIWTWALWEQSSRSPQGVLLQMSLSRFCRFWWLLTILLSREKSQFRNSILLMSLESCYSSDALAGGPRTILVSLFIQHWYRAWHSATTFPSIMQLDSHICEADKAGAIIIPDWQWGLTYQRLCDSSLI